MLNFQVWHLHNNRPIFNGKKVKLRAPIDRGIGGAAPMVSLPEGSRSAYGHLRTLSTALGSHRIGKMGE
jgi:hypothetical protein